MKKPNQTEYDLYVPSVQQSLNTRSSFVGGNYICHIEDNLQIHQIRVSNVVQAVAVCRAFVNEKRNEHGFGNGLVVDAATRKILCVFDHGLGMDDCGHEWMAGIPYTDEKQEEMVGVVLAHEANFEDNQIPFIWLFG